MTRRRIPEWEQRKALSEWLWEHGPVTARFAGELAVNVARGLNKRLDRAIPFSPPNATNLMRDMARDGLLTFEGTEQLRTKVTYVGQDPATIVWHEPTVVKQPSRLDRLEVEFAQLRESIPSLVAAEVRRQLEEYTS